MNLSAGAALIFLSGVLFSSTTTFAQESKSIAALMDKAFSAEETASKVEAVNLFVEDLSTSGLSVPLELAEKAAAMNAAVKTGDQLGKKAEEAHRVALDLDRDKDRLCAAEKAEFKKKACDEKVATVWKKRPIRYAYARVKRPAPTTGGPTGAAKAPIDLRLIISPVIVAPGVSPTPRTVATPTPTRVPEPAPVIAPLPGTPLRPIVTGRPEIHMPPGGPPAAGPTPRPETERPTVPAVRPPPAAAPPREAGRPAPAPVPPPRVVTPSPARPPPFAMPPAPEPDPAPTPSEVDIGGGGGEPDAGGGAGPDVATGGGGDRTPGAGIDGTPGAPAAAPGEKRVSLRELLAERLRRAGVDPDAPPGGEPGSPGPDGDGGETPAAAPTDEARHGGTETPAGGEPGSPGPDGDGGETPAAAPTEEARHGGGDAPPGGETPGGEDDGRAGLAAGPGSEPGVPAPEGALEPTVGTVEDDGLGGINLNVKPEGTKADLSQLRSKVIELMKP